MAQSRILDYSVSSMDSFFFDNSAWMYIFGPLAGNNERKQRMYSRLLAEIQSRGAMIFVTSMVLSEFVNRCLRIDFDLWKKECGFYVAEYKRNYVGTERHREAVEDIVSNVRVILKMCQRLPDDFNSIGINEILKNLEAIDFNDSYYNSASRRNWK